MFLKVPTCRSCDKQYDEVIELPNSDIGATEKGKYYICSKCLRQALITLDEGII